MFTWHHVTRQETDIILPSRAERLETESRFKKNVLRSSQNRVAQRLSSILVLSHDNMNVVGLGFDHVSYTLSYRRDSARRRSLRGSRSFKITWSWYNWKPVCNCNLQLVDNTDSPVTALHEMQTRSSDENSVCLSVRLSVRPSVRPSVCHTRDPWQNGRKICPDLYTIRKNI